MIPTSQRNIICKKPDRLLNNFFSKLVIRYNYEIPEKLYKIKYTLLILEYKWIFRRRANSASEGFLRLKMQKFTVPGEN